MRKIIVRSTIAINLLTLAFITLASIWDYDTKMAVKVLYTEFVIDTLVAIYFFCKDLAAGELEDERL